MKPLKNKRWIGICREPEGESGRSKPGKRPFWREQENAAKHGMSSYRRPSLALFGADGWGTALRAGRSRVRFPMVSLEFFIEIILPAAPCHVHRVYSACNRNEYQEYFLGVKAAGAYGWQKLPLSWANCLEIWERHPTGNLRASPDLYRYRFISCAFYSWRIHYHKPPCSYFWSSDTVPLYYWIAPWRLNWHGTFQFNLYTIARIRAWTTATYVQNIFTLLECELWARMHKTLTCIVPYISTGRLRMTYHLGCHKSEKLFDESKNRLFCRTSRYTKSRSDLL